MLLIFPGAMPAALERAVRAEVQGLEVLGASSIPADSAAQHYRRWAYLPRYDDPGFEATLVEVAKGHGVTRIYSPHTVVYAHLKKIMARLLPDVSLEPTEPFVEEIASYRALLKRRDAMGQLEPIASPTPPKPALTPAELAGLLRFAGSVPGLCSEEKILALAAAARLAPAGDIVELGSWWGKSAVALGWLGRRYGIGKLLCVDPWSLEEATQANADVNAQTAKWDMEEVVRVFQTNLAMLAGEANYLRLPSREAAGVYARDRAATSEAFGETRYAGRIALLHIDANHELGPVREDVRLWTPMIAPGGWAILDDYEWPFGDGVRIAGDELLAAWGDEAAAAFVSGTALFVQRRA
jgi:hypothetical protein